MLENYRTRDMKPSDGTLKVGHVKTWRQAEGYGFLRPDGEDEDIFVHVKGLADGLDELKVGDRVSFDLRMSERSGKLRAQQVRVLPGT